MKAKTLKNTTTELRREYASMMRLPIDDVACKAYGALMDAGLDLWSDDMVTLRAAIQVLHTKAEAKKAK